MLDAILGIASSSGLGAVVGLVGSYLAKREQRKITEMNQSHELLIGELDLKRDSAEATQALLMADKQIEQAEAEASIQNEVQAGHAFVASQVAASKSSGSVLVDSVRNLMRPAITIYLLVIVTVITYQLNVLLGGLVSLPVDELYKLYSHVINQAVFLTVTAVLWWFGSRGSKA